MTKKYDPDTLAADAQRLAAEAEDAARRAREQRHAVDRAADAAEVDAYALLLEQDTAKKALDAIPASWQAFEDAVRDGGDVLAAYVEFRKVRAESLATAGMINGYADAHGMRTSSRGEGPFGLVHFDSFEHCFSVAVEKVAAEVAMAARQAIMEDVERAREEAADAVRAGRRPASRRTEPVAYFKLMDDRSWISVPGRGDVYSVGRQNGGIVEVHDVATAEMFRTHPLLTEVDAAEAAEIAAKAPGVNLLPGGQMHNLAASMPETAQLQEGR